MNFFDKNVSSSMNRQLTVHLYKNCREKSYADEKYDLDNSGVDHERKGIANASYRSSCQYREYYMLGS